LVGFARGGLLCARGVRPGGDWGGLGRGGEKGGRMRCGCDLVRRSGSFVCALGGVGLCEY